METKNSKKTEEKKVRERPKEAAALYYDPKKGGAPKVVASGRGETAKSIIRIAEENEVPVYEDPVLARTLLSIDIGEEIPPEIYDIVSEVILFVSRLDEKYKEKYSRYYARNN